MELIHFEELHFKLLSAVLGINDPNSGLTVGGGFSKLT